MGPPGGELRARGRRAPPPAYRGRRCVDRARRPGPGPARERAARPQPRAGATCAFRPGSRRPLRTASESPGPTRRARRAHQRRFGTRVGPLPRATPPHVLVTCFNSRLCRSPELARGVHSVHFFALGPSPAPRPRTPSPLHVRRALGPVPAESRARRRRPAPERARPPGIPGRAPSSRVSGFADAGGTEWVRRGRFDHIPLLGPRCAPPANAILHTITPARGRSGISLRPASPRPARPPWPASGRARRPRFGGGFAAR